MAQNIKASFVKERAIVALVLLTITLLFLIFPCHGAHKQSKAVFLPTLPPINEVVAESHHSKGNTWAIKHVDNLRRAESDVERSKKIDKLCEFKTTLFDVTGSKAHHGTRAGRLAYHTRIEISTKNDPKHSSSSPSISQNLFCQHCLGSNYLHVIVAQLTFEKDDLKQTEAKKLSGKDTFKYAQALNHRLWTADKFPFSPLEQSLNYAFDLSKDSLVSKKKSHWFGSKEILESAKKKARMMYFSVTEGGLLHSTSSGKQFTMYLKVSYVKKKLKLFLVDSQETVLGELTVEKGFLKDKHLSYLGYKFFRNVFTEDYTQTTQFISENSRKETTHFRYMAILAMS